MLMDIKIVQNLVSKNKKLCVKKTLTKNLL